MEDYAYRSGGGEACCWRFGIGNFGSEQFSEAEVRQPGSGTRCLRLKRLKLPFRRHVVRGPGRAPVGLLNVAVAAASKRTYARAASISVAGARTT